MKKFLTISLVLGSFFIMGCDRNFLGGGAVGVVGTGAGYELHLNQEKNRVEDDFKNGKIDQKELDIRLDQIRRDSVIQ